MRAKYEGNLRCHFSTHCAYFIPFIRHIEAIVKVMRNLNYILKTYKILMYFWTGSRSRERQYQNKQTDRLFKVIQLLLKLNCIDPSHE